MRELNDSFALKGVALDLEGYSGGVGERVNFYRNNNGGIFMTAKNLGEALGYSKPTNAVSKIVNRNDYLKDERFYTKKKLLSDDGKRYTTTLWNEDGIKVILSLSNRPVHLKERTLKLLGNCDSVVIKPREEDENITLIKNALRMFRSEREVTIGGYRADLLFYENNLIVECDEFAHDHYNQEKERIRERELRVEGYDLYRFNPHEEGFCAGDVVGDILEILLEGKQ